MGRGAALKRLFERISDMSNLAVGAQQIVRLCRESNDLEQLQTLIQTDPSLVAQILRRVNSSYYALDAEVRDLCSAARLLGFREFSNLALIVYFSRMFSPPMAFGTFSIAGLWSHSVAVASAAQLVSRVCGCATPANAFTAGLLHDIGLLLCCRQMRRRFMQVVDRVRVRTMTPFVEHQVYSFDHAQLGAARGPQLGVSRTDRGCHCLSPRAGKLPRRSHAAGLRGRCRELPLQPRGLDVAGCA